MTNELNIRVATADDLPAIVALLADDILGQDREQVSSTGEVDEDYYFAFEMVAIQAGNEIYVGERDGEIIATAQLTLIPSLSLKGTLRAQIEGVRVASSQRGNGTGEALIKWLVEKSGTAGAGLVQLTTNKARTDALRFYERLGFETTHEGMKLYL